MEREANSTKPIAISAPAKAAITIIHEEMNDTTRSMTIMTMATNSFDPDDMPKTKGPAMGLPKKVCIRKPDRASPPPITAAAIMRGMRSFHTMFICVSPPSRRNMMRAMSDTDMCTLPELIFHTVSAVSAASRPMNTAQ